MNSPHKTNSMPGNGGAYRVNKDGSVVLDAKATHKAFKGARIVMDGVGKHPLMSHSDAQKVTHKPVVARSVTVGGRQMTSVGYFRQAVDDFGNGSGLDPYYMLRDSNTPRVPLPTRLQEAHQKYVESRANKFRESYIRELQDYADTLGDSGLPLCKVPAIDQENSNGIRVSGRVRGVSGSKL